MYLHMGNNLSSIAAVVCIQTSLEAQSGARGKNKVVFNWKKHRENVQELMVWKETPIFVTEV